MDGNTDNTEGLEARVTNLEKQLAEARNDLVKLRISMETSFQELTNNLRLRFKYTNFNF